MNISKSVFYFIISGIIFCDMLFISEDAHSNDNGSIDVVLIIDSSGSMKKTDPLSLRIPAAKLFISLLKRDDRIGIISFHDKGYPIIDLTPVDSDNKSKLFKAVEKINSSGLYTNLYDALSKALEMLSKDKQPQKAQIIILMSDGMMDSGNTDEDRLLHEKIKTELIGKLKDNAIKVYSIAFTEQSDRQLLEMVSKQTDGFYNLVLTDKDFHLIFTSVFESLKSPEMLPISTNKFLVDKSVEEVTIVATKDSPDIAIRLKSPDGKTFSYKDKHPDIKWFISNNFDMMTIKGPAIGRWEILFSTGKDNKVYVITDMRLQTNFQQLYTVFGEPLNIDIWLEKEGSIIKEKEILDKIDIYLELYPPQGEIVRIPSINKGEGVYTGKIAPFKTGNYKFKLIAKGKTFEREKTFVFNVTDIKESIEVMKANQLKNKEKEQLEQKQVKDVKTDEVLWKRVITQFLLINLAMGIVVFGYLKKDYLKSMLKRIKKIDRS